MRKSFSPDDTIALLQKTGHFCTYQERCSQDVEQKLRDWKVQTDKIDAIIDQLKEEGFIDDERFARSFVRGKFNINKWGRIKIGMELRGRNIPEAMVQEALEEIDEEDYLKTLRELILKKKQEIKTGKNFTIREKIINFAAGKGFEFDLIALILKELKI